MVSFESKTLVYLSLALGVHGMSIISRQTPGQAYCSVGEFPSVESCRGALGLINPGTGYIAGDQFWYGDCKIEVLGEPANPGAATVGGQEWIDLGNNIINVCGTIGWALSGGNANVTMNQCQVCYGGVCAVCNSPGQGPRPRIATKREEEYPRAVHQTTRAEPPKEEAERAISPDRVRRSTYDMPTRLETAVKRQETPYDGLVCYASAASGKASCMELADQIQPIGSLTLPYTNSHTSDSDARVCEVAVVSTSGANLDADSTHVAQMLRDATNACLAPTGDYVGKMWNNHGYDYELWGGMLCGEFGFGMEGCEP